LYSKYAIKIQKADISRLLIVYHEGGIYSDLDAFPLEKGRNSLDDLRKRATLVFPQSRDGRIITNHFFMATKHSPFLHKALSEAKFHTSWIMMPYLKVFASTGPLFVSKILQSWVPSKAERIVIVTTEEVKMFVEHTQGRSWITLDGKLFNWLSDHPHVEEILILIFIKVFDYRYYILFTFILFVIVISIKNRMKRT